VVIMKSVFLFVVMILMAGTAMSAELYYCSESKASGFRVTSEKKYSPARFRGGKFNMLLHKKRKTILLTLPYAARGPAPVKSGEGGITELYMCKISVAYKKNLFDCSGAATTAFSSFAFNPENGRFTRTRHFGNLAGRGAKGKWGTQMEDAFVSYGKCSKVSGN